MGYINILARLLTVIFLVQGSSVFGDINADITACENAGGGSCIFKILRQLAQVGGGSIQHDPMTSGAYLCHEEDHFVSQAIRYVQSIQADRISVKGGEFGNAGMEFVCTSSSLCNGLKIIDPENFQILSTGRHYYLAHSNVG